MSMLPIEKQVKKTFYKVVSSGIPEYPEGIIFRTKKRAMEWSNEEREQGCRAYVRVVKMTEKEFRNTEEIDF